MIASILKRGLVLAPLLAASLLPLQASAFQPAVEYAAENYLQRPPQDEIIYFVLPDRFANGDTSNDKGGLQGDRMHTGFDPSDHRFYHGGDIKGLSDRLDYIQGLGVTALWIAPIFKNKPVQVRNGAPGAGYHGYWITDFTDVDPHFGTRDDFRKLVEAAHARGMKVYMDIIINHTADVIQYRECSNKPCPYRSKSDYPVTLHQGLGGEAINTGFNGDGAGLRTEADFASLKNPTYAYTPYVAPGDEHVKKPEWLNNPIYYHNRGDTDYFSEDTFYGDFDGLDDIYTENPRVLQGFIEVYGRWIDDFAIDGFRVDTARHVNPEFWHVFVPAMRARAAAKGIANFHVFGEFADTDSSLLAAHTYADQFPAVIDFAFARAAVGMIAGQDGTNTLANIFRADPIYNGGWRTALQLPTFTGNHDAGRFSYYLHKQRPQADGSELAKRILLGNAAMMFSRGVPTLYYGDEQGLISGGDYGLSREDMFPTKTAVFANATRVSADMANPGDHFDRSGGIYRQIAEMSRIRKQDYNLRNGKTVIRYEQKEPGLLAFSRFDDVRTHGETLVALNTSDQPIRVNIPVDLSSLQWASLSGRCESRVNVAGSYAVEVPALGYVVCKSSASSGE